jgi:quercetin dioxygenase-like cupin family protein
VSAFAEIQALAPIKIWDGVIGRAVHGELITLSVVELQPGCVIPAHEHENEQVGMLISGALTFRVGEERRELGPGATWCIGAHVSHEVTTGPRGAVVIESFSPARVDWLGLEGADAGAPNWPLERPDD